MYVAAVDMGARTVKSVVMDGERRILGKGTRRCHPDFPRVARETLSLAMEDAGLAEEDLSYIATTGFGRYNVPFRDIQITDITCGARGAAFLFPGTRSVLDIGSQSTRAVAVFEGGRVKGFHSNDMCAAGAGGFIERAARYLEVELEEVGMLSFAGDNPQPISSICAVLAESELINHVTNDLSVENILRGVHDSMATRSFALLKRVGVEAELTFIGGLAGQAGMVAALEEKLKMKVNVPEEPDFVGALGAAILAMQRVEKGLGVKEEKGRLREPS
jgi:predicted CoA-substrate-specific enzyme activase